MSSTKQVGPPEGSALKKSDTDENCRVCRPTDRNRRTTESRNSGSSSTIETLGWASRIPGACIKGALLRATMASILLTVRRHGTAALPKLKAERLSHRLGSLALLCREPSPTLPESHAGASGIGA